MVFPEKYNISAIFLPFVSKVQHNFQSYHFACGSLYIKLYEKFKYVVTIYALMSYSKLTWDKKVAEHWKYITPPGHPSKSELQIYDSHIKKLKNDAKVLILGSTPELRDLCLKHHLVPVCVDYHSENFYILKHLMKEKGKEKLISADWRKMRLKEKYDLISGDVALQMVPFKENKKILFNIHKVLEDKGIFIHRNWIRIKGAYKNFKQIVRENKNRRGKMSTFASLSIPFVQHCFNDKKGYILFSQAIVPKIKEGYKKGYFTKKEYLDMHKAWSNYKMPNYLPTKERFERLIKKFFSIQNISYGRMWCKKFAPIYVLEKR